MDSAVFLASCLVVVASAVWVGFDARKREWSDGSGTAAWVLGTLLFWILVFPYYLVKRGRVGVKGEAPASVQGPSEAHVTARASVSSWVAGGAAVGMAIGSIAPWATVLAISVSGFDTDDGVIILVGAAIAGIAVLLHARSRGRGWAGLSLICGVVAFAASLYDRSNLSHLTSDSGGLARVGWGLNLTVVASAVLVIASFRLLLHKPELVEADSAPVVTPTAPPVVAPTPPAGWYPDPLGVGELRYWSGDSWTEHTHTATPSTPAESAGAASPAVSSLPA